MRALISALYTLIVLFGVTSTAMAQCREIQTPAKQRLTAASKRFVPIAVVLNAPDGEEYRRVPMLQMTFQFWVAGNIPLRHDRLGYLKRAHVCELGLPGARFKKTYLEARAEKVPEVTAQNATAIGSWIFFPQTVVASRPDVGLTLASGTVLKGVWGERKIEKGQTVPTLTISKVEE